MFRLRCMVISTELLLAGCSLPTAGLCLTTATEIGAAYGKYHKRDTRAVLGTCTTRKMRSLKQRQKAKMS